jgi:hypothetical protein
MIRPRGTDALRLRVTRPRRQFARRSTRRAAASVRCTSRGTRQRALGTVIVRLALAPGPPAHVAVWPVKTVVVEQPASSTSASRTWYLPGRRYTWTGVAPADAVLVPSPKLQA